jgi:hypothetical protein
MLMSYKTCRMTPSLTPSGMPKYMCLGRAPRRLATCSEPRAPSSLVSLPRYRYEINFSGGSMCEKSFLKKLKIKKLHSLQLCGWHSL